MARFTDRLGKLNPLHHIINLINSPFNFDQTLQKTFNLLASYNDLTEENRNPLGFAKKYKLDLSVSTIAWDGMINGDAFSERGFSNHELYTRAKYWHMGEKFEILNAATAIIYNLYNNLDNFYCYAEAFTYRYNSLSNEFRYMDVPLFALEVGVDKCKFLEFKHRFQVFVFQMGYSEDDALRVSNSYQYKALLYTKASLEDALQVSNDAHVYALEFNTPLSTALTFSNEGQVIAFHLGMPLSTALQFASYGEFSKHRAYGISLEDLIKDRDIGCYTDLPQPNSGQCLAKESGMPLIAALQFSGFIEFREYENKRISLKDIIKSRENFISQKCKLLLDEIASGDNHKNDAAEQLTTSGEIIDEL